MQVQVVDGLRPAHAVVDHDAEPVLAQPLLLGDLPRHEEQVAEGLFVLGRRGLGEPAEPVAGLWDHQEMDGGLRGDVAEGQALGVLEDDVCRDLLGDDLVEEGGVPGVGALRGAVD